MPACPGTSICESLVQTDDLALLPAAKSLRIHFFRRKQSLQMGPAGVGFSRLLKGIVKDYQQSITLSSFTKDQPMFRLPKE